MSEAATSTPSNRRSPRDAKVISTPLVDDPLATANDLITAANQLSARKNKSDQPEDNLIAAANQATAFNFKFDARDEAVALQTTAASASAAKWHSSAASYHSTGLSVESGKSKKAEAHQRATPGAIWLGPSTEPPLLKTLRTFLSNPALAHVIRWARHGKSFVVENKISLQDLANGDAVTANIAASGVLPQLKRLGFTRLYNDGTSSIWHHRLFRRLDEDGTAAVRVPTVPTMLEAGIPSATSTAPTMSWGERMSSVKVSIRCAAFQADDTVNRQMVATLPGVVPTPKFQNGAFCAAFGCVKRSQGRARSKGLCRVHFVEFEATKEDSSSDEEEIPCINRNRISLTSSSRRLVPRYTTVPPSPPATGTSTANVPAATRVSVICSALDDSKQDELFAILPPSSSCRIVKGRPVPASPAHQFGEGWTVEEHPRTNNRNRIDKYWFSPKRGSSSAVVSVSMFCSSL